MKINQKRNLFVFVSLIIGAIWFLYFNLAIIPSALSDPALMEAFIAFLPHNITMGIGVVFCYLAYKKYTPRKIILAFVFFIISMLLGGALGLMILPAVITTALAMFLKINQESTKFVGE